MGFININGQSVHTSNISSTITISGTSGTCIGTGSTTTISGSNLVYNTGGFTIQPARTTYHVLGEDIEVDGYKDFHLASAVATLNVLGKSYYDEMRKQDFHFPDEIEEYLEKKFIVLERDRKIDEVIKK